jgi:hypothetical protein
MMMILLNAYFLSLRTIKIKISFDSVLGGASGKKEVWVTTESSNYVLLFI